MAIAALLCGLGALAGPALFAKLGPYPSLGSKCGVFPRPGAEVAAGRRLAARPARLEPGHLRARRCDPRSDEIIDYINAHGGDRLHPDFGSPREYGIPYRVVGKRQRKRIKVRFTAYGDESDHGKYRVPLGSPVEGGSDADGDRHVLAYDRARCKLYELYRAFPRPAAEALGRRLGRDLGPALAGLRTDG